jgi:hypothetical protein
MELVPGSDLRKLPQFDWYPPLYPSVRKASVFYGLEGGYMPRYVIQRGYGQNIEKKGVTGGVGAGEGAVCGASLQWVLLCALLRADLKREAAGDQRADGFAASTYSLSIQD